MDFQSKFEEGLSYQDFLARYGSEEHQRRWQGVYDSVTLSGSQTELLTSFKREILVLCMAGAWCGDCVQQCPIFHRFAEANDRIALRFVDRDDHTDLHDHLGVCGAPRVPAVLFMNEDFEPVARYGDRTLAKYRRMAAEQLGANCPTGIGAPDEQLLSAVTQEWLDEFERVHLICRTSPRLRKKHND